MEQIDSGQIHLWCAYLGEITDPRRLGKCRLLLSEEELQKQGRFHFERDRHRYLVTRAMLRTVLSKYSDVAPREWRFSVNAYGKPSIAAEHRAARRIEFNVSHADGLVVMGVACDRAIGVDVENVRTRQADIDIADRYFAPAEVRALRALPSEQRQQRFFEYWTLKESYVKARGMGLSIPLDRFAVDVGNLPQIRLTIHASIPDCAEQWFFWQVKSGRDHLIALCTECSAAEVPYLAPARCWP